MARNKIYANIDIGMLTPLFRFRLVAILLNWVFQGLLYADNTERAFKICLDFVLAVIAFMYLPNLKINIHLIDAFLISHTFCWLFNGQLFALLKNFNMVYNSPQRIIDYADGIKRRASKEKSINCVAVYGSLTRGEMSPQSDLDIRIIRMPGIINGIRACLFGFSERSRALINRFPLDLYVIDNKSHLLKMRKDETPIILYARTDISISSTNIASNI